MPSSGPTCYGHQTTCTFWYRGWSSSLSPSSNRYETSTAIFMSNIVAVTQSGEFSLDDISSMCSTPFCRVFLRDNHKMLRCKQVKSITSSISTRNRNFSVIVTGRPRQTINNTVNNKANEKSETAVVHGVAIVRAGNLTETPHLPLAWMQTRAEDTETMPHVHSLYQITGRIPTTTTLLARARCRQNRQVWKTHLSSSYRGHPRCKLPLTTGI